MTPPEMLFACNEAASSHPGTVAGVAKLRTAGHGKNVRVELNDIGRQFHQDIAPALPAGQAVPPRLLIRTYRRQPRQWDPDLAGIAPEVIERLAALGVLLIGIDSASVVVKKKLIASMCAGL